jgi:hypothetical protein
MALSPLAAAPPAQCAPHSSRCRAPRLARATPQPQPLSRALGCSRPVNAGGVASLRGGRLACAAAEAPPPPPPDKEASVEETTRKWGLEAGLWKVRSAAECATAQLPRAVPCARLVRNLTQRALSLSRRATAVHRQER